MDYASSRDVEHVKAGMAGRKSAVGVKDGDRIGKGTTASSSRCGVGSTGCLGVGMDGYSSIATTRVSGGWVSSVLASLDGGLGSGLL